MSLRIFISWQSDIKDNRSVIFEAIQKETKRIIEERGVKLEIDHSTLNVAGAPQIEDSILDKICKCDIFISDVTPVVTFGEKQMPNSNVLLELGFAIRHLGWDRILLVALKGSWKEKDLPFDLNHHRIFRFQPHQNGNWKVAIDTLVDYCLAYSHKGFVYLPEYIQDTVPLTIYESPTIFFAQRMATAFAGKRGLFEITDKSEIIECLSHLFQEPLKFESAESPARIDPIWLLRGGYSMNIDHFSILDNNHILLGNQELHIKKICGYRDSGSYHKEYLYIETEADKPSGIEEYEKEFIEQLVTKRGYCNEEYAIFNYEEREYKISRQEYDDGATAINGRLIPLNRQAQLRIRYLTSYNFIVAAKDSPYNSQTFDSISGNIMNALLYGAADYQQFHEMLMSLTQQESN